MNLTLWWSLQACKVVDAPDNLQELMSFTFTGFDDPATLEAAGAEVLALVDANREDLLDGMRVDGLSRADIEAAGVPGAEVEDEIMGAVGLVSYGHGVEKVLTAVTFPNKEQIFEDTLAYEVHRSDDRQCFLAGKCEEWSVEATETTQVPLLGQAERELDQVLVRVDAEEVPMVFQRTLVPAGVELGSDLMKVHQQYGVMVMWDDGRVATRLEAFWVDAEIIGMDVPDSFAVDQAVLSMQGYAEQIDAWLDR